MLCLGFTALVLRAQEIAAPEDDPQRRAARKLIQQLFADRMARARATVDKADDLALAEALLVSAREATGEPVLFTLLCEQAYEWGTHHRDGYFTAIAAMKLLSKYSPERREETEQKILGLYKKQYYASRGRSKVEAGHLYLAAMKQSADRQFENGDLDEALQDYQRARTLARSLRSKDLPQIESAIDALVERQKVERQLSRLKARLKQDPDNQVLARKLIEWLVVRLDAPLEARKYTFLVDDPKLRQRVAWAAMPADQRTADQSYALGMWYEQLAEDVRQDEQKQPLLERSLDHLHDYLKKDQTKNLKHTASQLMIDKLQKQLDRIRLANAKDVTSGLLARWGFDDPKKLGYESRRRYHGKPSGPGVRWFRDRQRGGVIAFDGSGAHLKLPANPQAGHTAGSWAFWMKVDNVPAGYGGQFYIQETCIWIALSGGGVGIDMSNGSGWFDRNGGQATGAIAGKGRITPNTWHHIAFTWDGKTLRGYHNGAASFTTQTVGPKARAQVSKLGPGTRSAMGSRVTSKRFDLKGLMDEFRIYNRALSGKEVMAIVRATHPGRGR